MDFSKEIKWVTVLKFISTCINVYEWFKKNAEETSMVPSKGKLWDS